jgi:hypothetical protein
MRRAILIAMALCCAAEATARAEPPFGPFASFIDGNKLFGECAGFRTQGTFSPDEVVRFRYCEAYVVGVSDSIAMVRADLERGGTGATIKYCPPDGVDSHQLTSVATNYLRDNPQKRHLAAASLVANALAKGFPCNT